VISPVRARSSCILRADALKGLFAEYLSESWRSGPCDDGVVIIAIGFGDGGVGVSGVGFEG
jgi:hypothetical protein